MEARGFCKAIPEAGISDLRSFEPYLGDFREAGLHYQHGWLIFGKLHPIAVEESICDAGRLAFRAVVQQPPWMISLHPPKLLKL